MAMAMAMAMVRVARMCLPHAIIILMRGRWAGVGLATAGLLALAGCGDDEGARDAMVDAAAPDAQLLTLLAPASLEVTENQGTRFDVSLASAPTGTVNVDITATPPGVLVVVQPRSLSFYAGNFATPQRVLVRGVDDADIAPRQAVVHLSGQGVASHDIAVTVVDDDHPELQVTPAQLFLRFRDFSGAAPVETLSVRLSQPPLAEVVVDVRSADATVATVSPSTLRFTPADHADPHLLTVTGHPEDDDLQWEATSLLLQAPWGVTSVGVTHDDHSEQSLLPTPVMVRLTEGASAAFQVRLESRPASTVTIDFASSDATALGVDPTSYAYTSAFYPGSVPITVTALQDANAISETVTVTVSSMGLTPRMVTVVITDDD